MIVSQSGRPYCRQHSSKSRLCIVRHSRRSLVYKGSPRERYVCSLRTANFTTSIEDWRWGGTSTIDGLPWDSSLKNLGSRTDPDELRVEFVKVTSTLCLHASWSRIGWRLEAPSVPPRARLESSFMRTLRSKLFESWWFRVDISAYRSRAPVTFVSAVFNLP